MATSDVWSDFEHLRQNVKHNTVDRLKQILNGLNDECHAVLFRSGKKQDLIDRIIGQLDHWRQANNVDKWVRAKAVLHLVRNSGTYLSTKMPATPTLNAAAAPYSAYPVAGPNLVPTYRPPTGSSTIRYDPYGATILKPTSSAIPTASTSTSALAVPSKSAVNVRFKPSPFLRVDQAVSTVVECPESASQNDRRQGSILFTLTDEHFTKLTSQTSKYELRLYCTSSTFYSAGPNAFRTNAGPCPIEFPPTCEVRVNGTLLSANLKGLKKKPGTAPPPDLGKSVRLAMATSNRVEIVYVNSQQPAIPKKYYLVVMLVEITTVVQLVDRLKKGKYRSCQEVLSKMVESHNDDDDIVAGPQKMSLKCPLSFIRISDPCRSSRCVHPQCFNATAWFSLMQQTTTWLCPVCERVLNVDELIIDGYFDQILKETPESVEDVMVEADGEWHTTDNQYASAQWRSTHPPVPEPNPSPPSSTPKRTPATQSPSQSLAREQVKVKASGDDVVVLDSDDEDEGRVKRELSPSFARDSSGQRSFSTIPLVRTQTRGEDVIDLTLDSDDDEPPRQNVVPTLPPPTQVVEKRKAVEPEPTVVGSQPKKVRTDDSNDSLMRAMAMRTLNMASPSSSSQGARDHGSSHSQRPLSSSQRSASASQSRYTGPNSSQASRYPSSRPPYYAAPYANGFTPVPVPRGSSGGGSASPSGSYRSNGASSARWS